MKTRINPIVAIVLVVLALAAIGFMYSKSATQASSSNMTSEVPKSSSGLPDAPRNPFADQALKGKGRTNPDAGVTGSQSGQ